MEGMPHSQKYFLPGLRYTGETLIFVHAALQPAIYFLSGSKLRMELRQLLPCIFGPAMVI